MEDTTSLKLRLTKDTKNKLDAISKMEYCSLNYQLITLVMNFNPSAQFEAIKHKENKTVNFEIRLPINLKDKLLTTSQNNRISVNCLIDTLIFNKHKSIVFTTFREDLIKVYKREYDFKDMYTDYKYKNKAPFTIFEGSPF